MIWLYSRARARQHTHKHRTPIDRQRKVGAESLGMHPNATPSEMMWFYSSAFSEAERCRCIRGRRHRERERDMMTERSCCSNFLVVGIYIYNLESHQSATRICHECHKNTELQRDRGGKNSESSAYIKWQPSKEEQSNNKPTKFQQFLKSFDNLQRALHRTEWIVWNVFLTLIVQWKSAHFFVCAPTLFSLYRFTHLPVWLVPFFSSLYNFASASQCSLIVRNHIKTVLLL